MRKIILLLIACALLLSSCTATPPEHDDTDTDTCETFEDTVLPETSCVPEETTMPVLEETTVPVPETTIPEELLNSPIADFSPEMKASEILEEVKKGGYVVLSRDTSRIVAGEELIDEFISLTKAGERMSLFVAAYRSEPYGFSSGDDDVPHIILTEIVYDGELYFGYHATYYDNAALLNKNKPLLEQWCKGYKYMMPLEYEYVTKNNKSLRKMYVAADDADITYKYISKVWSGVLFAEGWNTFQIVVDYIIE